MKHLLIVIIGCLSICADGIGQTTTTADTVLAEEYYQKGEALTDALKDFETALDYYEKAAAIFLKYEKWGDYINCLNHISNSYRSLRDHQRSLDFAFKARDLSYKHLDANSIQKCEAYQQIGFHYFMINKYTLALKYLDSAYFLYKNVVHPNVKTEISMWFGLGSTYLMMARYSIAEEYLKKSLKPMIDHLGPDHIKVGACYNQLGILYLDRYYYDSAVSYFSKSLEVIGRYYGSDARQLCHPTNNLGLAYLYKGDSEVAKSFIMKGISLVESDKSNYYYSVYGPILYNNLGIVYRDEGEIEKMLWCFNKALQIETESGEEENQIDIALTYENLALQYKNQREFQLAINSINRSLKIRKNHDYQHLVFESYCALGNVYTDMREYEKAETWLFKALNSQKNIFGTYHPKLAFSYSSIGDYYLSKGEYLEAAQYFQRSLCAFSNNSSDTLVHQNLSVSLRNTRPNDFLYNYNKKALSFKKLYDTKGDIKDLKFAFVTYQHCDTLVNRIRDSHFKHSDKVQVGKRARETYEGAISVSLQLYQLTEDIRYLHSAFYFSERSKAAALSHGLSDLKARNLSGVPQELLSLESRLKSDMAVYQQQAQDEKSKLGESDSASVSYFQDRLFYATRSYDSLIRVLEKNYPHYYALKYSTNTVSLIDLEAKLDKNTALIEYFVGDSTTYVFYATRGQSGYIALPHTRTLHDDVVALRANLNPQQVYDNPSGSYDAFVKASARVYDEYVKHVIQKLPAPVTNLIIIPDGSLGYIPFEVLLTARPESGDYASLPYLMKRYRVSYGYSASLLEEYESVRKRNSKVNYLAFAPRYASEETDSTRLLRLGRYRSQVTPLHWNTAEAIRIGRYLPGKSLVDDEAKESVFKEEVNKYSILHLAMHALVDDQRPMNSKFVFSAVSDSTEDGFLTANELYAMDLSADLVVLSACETGYGKLEKGEGIMSLARAFSYAGCPSVVMSHWVVDDEATAQLMEYFYKHLSSGLSKDESLQQARVDYLAHADVLKQHPAFWAGFVVLGDTRAITERSSGWVYVMMGGIVLIVVGFYLSKKLRRRT